MDTQGLTDNLFRANVGGVVVNSEGKVLALERSDIPEAWQLPQGGLREGEEPLAAAKRELQEETGVSPAMVELLDEYPDWLPYELPKEKRSPKTGRGQVQKWFLFRFVGAEDEINLTADVEQEFSRWRWMSLIELARTTAPFRRPVYEKLVEWFRPHLAG